MTGTNEEMLNQYKLKLQSRFRMKDLGEPTEYLGINIIRDKSKGIFKLNQTKIINKMLHKFGYEQAYPQRSPMVTNQVLNRYRRDRESEATNKEVIDDSRYPEAVGSLLYLANATRPDVAYTVNVLSRH